MTIRAVKLILARMDGQRRVPLGIKVWRRGGSSKIVLASKLLRWAHRLGLTPEYVLFDSWYSGNRRLKQLNRYGWPVVTRLKKKRKLDGPRPDRRWPHRYGPAQGQLAGGVRVLVVKDGRRYWATTDLSLSPRQVKALYQLQQPIEETIRILKDQWHGGGSPARTETAQLAHLHLGLMAFCALQHEATASGTTIYRLRRSLFRQAIPRQSPLLQPFMDTA